MKNGRAVCAGRACPWGQDTIQEAEHPLTISWGPAHWGTGNGWVEELSVQEACWALGICQICLEREIRQSKECLAALSLDFWSGVSFQFPYLPGAESPQGAVHASSLLHPKPRYGKWWRQPEHSPDPTRQISTAKESYTKPDFIRSLWQNTAKMGASCRHKLILLLQSNWLADSFLSSTDQEKGSIHETSLCRLDGTVIVSMLCWMHGAWDSSADEQASTLPGW